MHTKDTEIYGERYWCVETAERGKENTSVKAYVCADHVDITTTGAVVLLKKRIDGSFVVNMAFAPGQWLYIYRVNSSGKAVAVDYWPGRIHRKTTATPTKSEAA